MRPADKGNTVQSPFFGWLLMAATASVIAAVTLVVTKLSHRLVLRWRGVRKARYVAALGEMISRRVIPGEMTPGWAEDPLFHDAVAEYRLTLSGEEHEYIDRLVETLGILDKLRELIGRRRLPQSRRLRAVATLVDLATESVIPVLRSLLEDPNPYVALHAAKGLSRLDDLESVPDILDQIEEAPEWHSARLADALMGFGLPAGPAVRTWVRRQLDDQDPSTDTISLAARVLGRIGDTEAESLLLELLTSYEPEWRVAAASALGRCGGREAVIALEKALEDDYWPVRARAAAGLERLADPTSSRKLAPLLTDPVWWVRQNAARAIGSLPGGHLELIRALGGADTYAADAALHQLTMLGAVKEAADRYDAGTATVTDLDLLSHAERMVSSLPAAATS